MPLKGQKLAKLKEEVDKPLAAILSLNTISHTIGATGAGAQAAILFGSQWIGLFSAALTLAILILSEVIPKTLGALYWRKLAGFVVTSLPILITLTYPLVWVSVRVGNLLKHGKPRQIMRNEIAAIAELGENEGAITSDETAYIRSLLEFRDVKVDEVMTPISVVSYIHDKQSIRETLEQNIPFSRIPIYAESDKNYQRYLLKDDLHDAMLADKGDQLAVSVSRPLIILPCSTKLPAAIKHFTKNQGHMAIVLDKQDKAVGVITLEDAVETLLGWEIVDEFDPVPDMRDLAEKNNDVRS